MFDSVASPITLSFSVACLLRLLSSYSLLYIRFLVDLFCNKVKHWLTTYFSSFDLACSCSSFSFFWRDLILTQTRPFELINTRLPLPRLLPSLALPPSWLYSHFSSSFSTKSISHLSQFEAVSKAGVAVSDSVSKYIEVEAESLFECPLSS